MRRNREEELTADDIEKVEEILREFFTMPRRKDNFHLSVQETTGSRRVEVTIDFEIGKEDELDVLEKNGFHVYTLKPINSGRNVSPRFRFDLKVPEEIPEQIEH